MAISTVAANGIDIAYEILGSGPTAVFIGGLDMDITAWRKTYANTFVQNGYQALMLNLRGTPPSTATEPPYSIPQLVEDCEAALRALQIEHAYVVGASLGALVSQEWILAYPQGKKAAALIATIGRQTAWMRLQNRGELELYRKGMTHPTDHVVASDLLQIFTVEELLNDARIEKTIELMKSRNYGAPGRLGVFQASGAYDNRLEALAGIRIPSIIFGFRNDVLTPAALGREVAEKIPGSRFVEVEGAAHAGIITKSQVLAPQIVAFFNSVR